MDTRTKAHSPSAPYDPDSSAISMAGASNDQYDAASITPALNPRLASSNFRCKCNGIK